MYPADPLNDDLIVHIFLLEPTAMRPLSEAEMTSAMEAHSLPADVADGVFTLVDTAELLGVSLPTMRGYLRRGMPFVGRGGCGSQWQIRLSEAWAWLGFFRQLKQQKHDRGVAHAAAAAKLKASISWHSR
ncbi:UNVERIFIED_ORG: hypothetical protein GGI66_002344 [Rhizobium esperanzae]